jgi:hypothetical protein
MKRQVDGVINRNGPWPVMDSANPAEATSSGSFSTDGTHSTEITPKEEETLPFK